MHRREKEKSCKELTASSNIWTSGSGRVCPIIARPSLSSSNVRYPFLSLSIIPNISLIPSTCSSGRLSATTWSEDRFSSLGYFEGCNSKPIKRVSETYPKNFLFESVHQGELLDPHSHLVSKRNISNMILI